MDEIPPHSEPVRPFLLIIHEEPSTFDPISALFGLNPFMNANFNMNFRSNFDDELINLIIRISEEERGRMGNPPASK
jgi:hypothetical protein